MSRLPVLMLWATNAVALRAWPAAGFPARSDSRSRLSFGSVEYRQGDKIFVASLERNVEQHGSSRFSRLALRPVLTSHLRNSRFVVVLCSEIPPIMNARPDSRASRVLDSPNWPKSWPYSERDLQPMDRLPDWTFYLLPRFVHHVDDAARRALQRVYEALFASRAVDAPCLDICSSWTSHYPEKLDPARRVVALGLNAFELMANPSQTEWRVRDLNADPTLPFEDEAFEFVTCALSIDYMRRPAELLAEVQRVLRPGGLAVFSFSNRCFVTKVVKLWIESHPSDVEHVWVVGSYFHFTQGFDSPVCVDVSPGSRSDPLYVVMAAKSQP